jgi:hypothetical protein
MLTYNQSATTCRLVIIKVTICSYDIFQAKALAEKNERDLQAQQEQEERHVSSVSYHTDSGL